ncbi:MAG TPA: FMN-binding negative transcriptional regulator [Ktedonobacteraceae bacterium]
MYVPKHFREEDLAVLQTLMRQYSFATLVSTQEDGLPIATHLPVLLEAEPAPYGTLKAHLALGNPQWRALQEEREVLVIFQGPHAYISPSWYEVELSVPTWNYATVHAYGRPRLISEVGELYTHLSALVSTYEGNFPQPSYSALANASSRSLCQSGKEEPSYSALANASSRSLCQSGKEEPWPFEKLPLDYVEKMMKGVVGLSIEITRLEGKYKMSQNRSTQDQQQVVEHLNRSADTTIRGVAAIMRERLSRQVE